ncbi:hypothetical protein Fcan01_19939 [Folsomia candida]|uniref:Uncharacterized protein n=1 Tax=Folsomia candida TaxID=158441 RepID=A0A226DIA1_FOLCA|nr:hypothetical protein Fcan01_19939 [Folsomia candida]
MRWDVSTSVTLYDEEDYEGANYTYSISGTKCITIPKVTWKSIKISGTATTTCVVLHDDATCGGNSVQLRPGYPHLYDLWLWGFRHDQNLAVYARSASLCGNSCPEVIDNFSAVSESAIVLILLAILFALVVVWFGEVYFFQWYRDAHYPSHQERHVVKLIILDSL